jgi:hypothetical protein
MRWIFHVDLIYVLENKKYNSSTNNRINVLKFTVYSKLVENFPLWRNYYPQNDFIYTLNASEQA